MAEDWAAVADAITARMQERRINQRVLAQEANVSVATIRELQHNYTTRRRSARTLRAIATALEWPPDQLNAILNGDVAAEPAPEADLNAIDVAGIVAELSHMRVLLAKILDRLEKLPAEIEQQRRRS